uniref:BTB domain-containing protein n=1 Tax=Panagrolaimus davidi TaxID=227884 RepID=A0A914QUV3_9BILA
MGKTEHPFSVIWHIKEQFLVAIRYQEGEKYRSKRFQIAPDSKYFLSIYPKRNATDTYIFINVETGNKKEIECKAKITVESAGVTKDFQHIFQKSMGHGIDYCFTHELFDPKKKYFIDGEMIVSIEGVFIFDEAIEAADESILNTSGKKAKLLGQVFWERDDKDFKIIIDKKDIQAHKHILSAQSPVFEGMFNSGMKEARNSKVDIPNYDFEAVEIIVKLCYDLDIPGDLLVKHSIQLYEFVDQYQMDTVRDMIETYLIKKISPSNVCSLAKSSVSIKNSKLYDFCFNFLLKCLKETTAVADMDLLDKETALKLLKNAFTKVVKCKE